MSNRQHAGPRTARQLYMGSASSDWPKSARHGRCSRRHRRRRTRVRALTGCTREAVRSNCSLRPRSGRRRAHANPPLIGWVGRRARRKPSARRTRPSARTRRLPGPVGGVCCLSGARIPQPRNNIFEKAELVPDNVDVLVDAAQFYTSAGRIDESAAGSGPRIALNRRLLWRVSSPFTGATARDDRGGRRRHERRVSTDHGLIAQAAGFTLWR